MATLPKRVGPFRIEGVLGAGGTAEVYRARRDGSGAPVALKVPRPGLSGRQRKLFLDEARATRDLQSAHLVRILASDLDAPRPWIAMELAPGRDLAAVLEGARSRARDAAPAILCGILEAIRTLHQAGLVHHDVTPANVLLGEKDEVVLVDMGLLGRPGAKPSGNAGTLAYQAPEVLRGAPHRDAADLYQAAAVTYEVISGLVPHEDLGGGYLDRRKAGDPPALVTEVCTGASAAVAQLLADLLDPDPKARPDASAALKRARFIAAPWFHGPPTAADFGPSQARALPGRAVQVRRHRPRGSIEPETGGNEIATGWILGALAASGGVAWLLGLF